MPLAFSTLLVKVLILVKAFINFEPKFEDAFHVFNTFRKSIDFTTGIHEFWVKIGGCLKRFYYYYFL